MPYYTRIFETLDYKEETEGKVFIDTFSEIHVSKVSFKYNTGNENVLKNIDIKIKKGEYTAIIGKSGCGKTTLAKIILSLYSSKMGQVKIDGVNIHEVSKPSYYENIGFVMQDNYLFNMTLRENFLLANINASEEDMANACKKVNLYSFIDNLPDKFDTVIGERGVKLSGGQKQRIAIAQALLRKPKLIIFDEATSSLDKESEDIINQSITNISKETTIIVISHKPATILRADKIIVLDNGNIVDYGLHDDLIKRNGFLKKLSGGLYEW